MNRRTPAFEATSARTVVRDGIELLAFHGCGYLGLAHEPRVLDAAQVALERYGASGLASRTTSGTLDLHERLESQLAEFLGLEAALVLPDGYLADFAAATGVGAGRDIALLDEDAHPSLVDAARLAGLNCVRYGAGDMMRAVALLDRHQTGSPLVMTDGVFAMHGRLAPVADLLRHLPSGGVMIVDDCHGVGVLGEAGGGTLEAFGVHDERVVLTGSLGKALGSGGGFLAGTADMVSRVRKSAGTFIGTTALSPPLAAAASKAIEILESEPERLERLRANTGALHRTARRVNVRSTGTFFPVLRIELDSPQATRGLSAALHVEGIFAPVVEYFGTGVLRLAVNSEHTAADLRRLEESLERHLPG